MGGQRVISWIGILAGLAVMSGALCAVVWARVVQLPVYVVNDDHYAHLTERGHTEVIAADAWFVVIGLVAGLLLGSLAWSWFKSLGWPVAIIGTVAGVLAGAVCWGIGQLLGPGPLGIRLADAKPGDSVPIPFQLHSAVALAAWGLAAVTPSLLLSALGPELPDLRGGSGPRGRVTDPVGTPADEPEPAEVD